MKAKEKKKRRDKTVRKAMIKIRESGNNGTEEEERPQRGASY